jgi:hypothetical protein
MSIDLEKVKKAETPVFKLKLFILNKLVSQFLLNILLKTPMTMLTDNRRSGLIKLYELKIKRLRFNLIKNQKGINL